MNIALPKTITLRLTKRALDAVPASSLYDMEGDSGLPVKTFEKSYGNPHRCLICQAVRQRFPDIDKVSVYPGSVEINGKEFEYSLDHEPDIREAHKYPDKFKPFAIKLTRHV